MNKTTDASAIFAPLWRRKWLILAAGILVALGAYEQYKRKPVVFVSQTEINLNPGAEGATGGKKSKVNTNALDDEITIIQSTVLESVVRRLRREHDLSAAHAKVHAKGAGASDFLVISAEAHTAKAATTAANATARAYINRRQRNHEQAVLNQITALRRKIRRLEAIPAKSKKSASGSSATSTTVGAVSTAAALQIASISNKVNELETGLTVKVIEQLAPAKPGDAVRVASSSPKKNAEFGFILGIILASVAAYTLSRYNRRLITLAEIEAAF
jgi:capsular polysaccharide biosynthesis protein